MSAQGPRDNSWYGVTCDSAGKVTQLLLQSNDLSGSLPTQMGLATTLSAHLDAHANTKLKGSLPTEFGKLTELEALTLGASGFIG